jgi:hypothetical protein
MLTATPQPKARFCCIDGKTSLTAKIRRLERSINEQGRHWGGTSEEFADWALGRMASLLRTLSEHVDVVLDDA